MKDHCRGLHEFIEKILIPRHNTGIFIAAFKCAADINARLNLRRSTKCYFNFIDLGGEATARGKK
jgi:hypothetical protein